MMSDEKAKASSKKRGTSAERETQKATQAAESESASTNEEQDDDSKPTARDVNDDNDSAAAAQDDDNNIIASNRKRIWLKRKPNMSETELKKEKREANRLSAYHSRRRKNDIIGNLKATVEDTDKDTQKLMDEHQRLQSELTDLKANNQSLKSENEALRNELTSLDTPNPSARSLSNATADAQDETSQDNTEPPKSRRTTDSDQIAAASHGQQPSEGRIEPSQEHVLSPGVQGQSLEMQAQFLDDTGNRPPRVGSATHLQTAGQSGVTDQEVPNVTSSSDGATDVPHAALLRALLENPQPVYSRSGSLSTTTSDTSTIAPEQVVQLQQLLLQLQQQQQEEQQLQQQQQLQQASTHLISVQSSISFLPPRSTEASSSIPGTTRTSAALGTIAPPSVPSQQLANDLAAQQNLSPGETVRLLQILQMMNRQEGNPNQ